jgi:hypothetical protein
VLSALKLAIASQHVVTAAGLRLVAEDGQLKYYKIAWTGATAVTDPRVVRPGLVRSPTLSAFTIRSQNVSRGRRGRKAGFNRAVVVAGAGRGSAGRSGSP